MKWTVIKSHASPSKTKAAAAGKAKSYSGSTLGTVEADTRTAAVVKAIDQFRSLGLTVANCIVEEVKPVY